jgi:hypothetical protein
MTVRRWRSVALCSVVVVAVLILGGCRAGRPAEHAGQATANGVTVSVTLLLASNGQRDLRVTFSPQQPGFHIYSIDLPAQGVDGLGIPTRVAVQGDLTMAGKPTANLATRLLRMAGLPIAIPVYPDGPVTFTVPVRQTGSHQAEVIVSYGACSESRCLMPVVGKVIRIELS